MNGKELTRAQKKKADRIDALFASLKSEGVIPLIIEGGGCPMLTYWRDADTDIDTLYKGQNIYHSAKTQIDIWVP